LYKKISKAGNSDGLWLLTPPLKPEKSNADMPSPTAKNSRTVTWFYRLNGIL